MEGNKEEDSDSKGKLTLFVVVVVVVVVVVCLFLLPGECGLSSLCSQRERHRRLERC